MMMLAVSPLLSYVGPSPTKAALRSVGVVMDGGGPGNPARQKDEFSNPTYMYGKPFAPEGMGQEFINAPNVRKPLKDYVGASAELQVGRFIKGEPLEPWDPLQFCDLSKVSANNPDVAWLREAELKHGRVAMLAFVGIFFTAGGTHFPPEEFAAATDAGWPNALGVITKTNPGITAQAILAIGLFEGWSFQRYPGRWDGLWFGEREGSGIVAGDVGFDPLGVMPPTEPAASMMKAKELANGRLAMLGVMGLFAQYMQTGVAFP
jgi:hypothetical protein